MFLMRMFDLMNADADTLPALILLICAGNSSKHEKQLAFQKYSPLHNHFKFMGIRGNHELRRAWLECKTLHIRPSAKELPGVLEG